MGADAFEDVAQVGERIDVEPLARGDEAGQHCRRPSAVVATKEEPVLPSHRDPTQAALGAVVVDLQIAVFAVADQGFPVRQRVGDGLPFRTLRQHLGMFSLQIGFDVVKDGYPDPAGPTVTSTVQGKQGALYTLPKASITILRGRVR